MVKADPAQLTPPENSLGARYARLILVGPRTQDDLKLLWEVEMNGVFFKIAQGTPLAFEKNKKTEKCIS
jgi:hypothetical protein